VNKEKDTKLWLSGFPSKFESDAEIGQKWTFWNCLRIITYTYPHMSRGIPGRLSQPSFPCWIWSTG